MSEINGANTNIYQTVEKDISLKILSLDGGGAKGIYSLGILKEVEALVGHSLCEEFSLIYGTSTGAIIAALLGLGHNVDYVYNLYMDNVPKIMKQLGKTLKSRALRNMAKEIFKEKKFDEFKTQVGIVTTNWLLEKPMIFKTDIGMAHGMKATFTPGFGCSIADAVKASCAAYPFFKRSKIKTENQGTVELADGGYCANNPSLYALADAFVAMKAQKSQIKLLSVGVGNYPEPKYILPKRVAKKIKWIQLLQKTLNVNTCSMDQLRDILYPDVNFVRVNDTFEIPELATDFMESDIKKLNLLYQQGRDSYRKREKDIIRLLTCE